MTQNSRRAPVMSAFLHRASSPAHHRHDSRQSIRSVGGLFAGPFGHRGEDAGLWDEGHRRAHPKAARSRSPNNETSRLLVTPRTVPQKARGHPPAAPASRAPGRYLLPSPHGGATIPPPPPPSTAHPA